MTLLTTLAPQTATPVPGRPTPGQVAAILRARTRGTASIDATVAGEQDEWTTTTRPTYAQVEELIDLAMGDMAGMTEGRAPCSTSLAAAHLTAVCYRVGMLIETGYYPEQTNADESAFAALEKMWKTASTATAKAIVSQCPLVGSDGSVEVEGMPLGRVPCRVPTTWQTRW